MPAETDEFSPVYLDIALALDQIGDLQDVHGMLTMLEESLARDIPRIAQLLDAGDVVGANLLLHPLKGIIPIFCVPAMCEHVAQVEVLSKDRNSVSVKPAYAELQPELNVLLAEVTQYLGLHGAGA